MGCVKVTVQNLEVVRVDAEQNLLDVYKRQENQSRANFCKAALIWSAILLVLAFIFYMVVLAGVISGLG